MHVSVSVDPSDPEDIRKGLDYLKLLLQQAVREPQIPPTPANPEIYGRQITWGEVHTILVKAGFTEILARRLRSTLLKYTDELHIPLNKEAPFLGQLANPRFVSNPLGQHYPRGLINYPNTARKQVKAFNLLLTHFGIHPGSAPPDWRPPE